MVRSNGFQRYVSACSNVITWMESVQEGCGRRGRVALIRTLEELQKKELSSTKVLHKLVNLSSMTKALNVG